MSEHTYQSFGDLVRPLNGAPGGAAPLGAAAAPPPAAASPAPSSPATDAHTHTVAPRTPSLNSLTIGILGAQLAWTVEMAYGTPYLLALGLSKQATSLVWIAGPLSGLVVQPLVGALSDQNSHSRFRRRKYILISAALIVLATLAVAYARALAKLVATLAGLGDWDPDAARTEHAAAITLGVAGFYLLDFSLNGLQASLRALVLDRSPPHLQSAANAWLGRHTHLGNILGYLFGYLDLAHAPFLSWIDPPAAVKTGTDSPPEEEEGAQFRRLAVLSLAVMALTVAITCLTQPEGPGHTTQSRADRESPAHRERRKPSAWRRAAGLVGTIRDNIRTLPLPVRRVCYVQFFAWTAWFPFLFYSTTYVAEALYASLPAGAPLPSSDEATRAGSFALLLYSLVSLAAGTLLPFLTSLSSPPPPPPSPSPHPRPRPRPRASLARRIGPLGRGVLKRLTPRNVWTFGLGWHALVMLAGTFAVPFALVMESIRDLGLDEVDAPDAPSSASASSDDDEEPTQPDGTNAPSTGSASPSVSVSGRSGLGPGPGPGRKDQPPPSVGAASRVPFRVSALRRQPSSYQGGPPAPTFRSGNGRRTAAASAPEAREPDERTALLRAGPDDHHDDGIDSRHSSPPTAVAGGTILGLHNMAIVLPQFLVALVAAGIFKLTSKRSAAALAALSTSFLAGAHAPSPPTSGADDGGLRAQDDVVWVLRFGGVAAFVGMFVSRWVCETWSERESREWCEWGWRGDGFEEEGRVGEREGEREGDLAP
ncbi:hypothetical protein JCM8202v2_005583 [Rhodotorula sphaerocarpa]